MVRYLFALHRCHIAARAAAALHSCVTAAPVRLPESDSLRLDWWWWWWLMMILLILNFIITNQDFQVGSRNQLIFLNFEQISSFVYFLWLCDKIWHCTVHMFTDYTGLRLISPAVRSIPDYLSTGVRIKLVCLLPPWSIWSNVQRISFFHGVTLLL